MRATTQFPTLWPEGFNPNDQSRIAGAVIIDKGDTSGLPDSASTRFHTHPVGQLTVCLKGLVAVQVEDGIRAIPQQCAAWVPANVPHCGMIGSDSVSVFMMIQESPYVKSQFPRVPTRMMLNTMTFEMIKHFARFEGRFERGSHEEHIAAVIIEELVRARPLPIHFAPLPNHPLLKRLARLITEEEPNESNAYYAEALNMSDRSLLRLVKAQTGMSFKRWRTHLVLMKSLTHLNQGLSVEEVAYQAGYDYPSSFIETFKSVFGDTPGNYRLQQR